MSITHPFPTAVPAPASESASARGPRTINADAVATHTDPRTGRASFVVADGIGDHLPAARAARLAAAVAARVATASSATEGILAAQRELHAQLAVAEADCVAVVATLPAADRPGAPVDIAWVGDCRAYLWNGRVLEQLTVDHTLAEFYRDHEIATTPRMEHVVLDSVRTARPAGIGRARAAAGRLLLCTDGVHKALDIARIKAMLSDDGPAGGTAALLVETAGRLGGTDNATAAVIDRR